MATLNEEIGKLIARRLLADGAVTLPEVGALYTKRIAARRLSATQLQPPHRVVEFSTTPMGLSLVEEIRREAHCSEEQAADAYARWRTKATQEGRLEIEGVGILCLKTLTPTEEFEQRLNPQGKSPIRVKRRPMPWWIWTLLTLGGISLVFGALAWLVNPLEVWKKWSGTKSEVVQPAPENLQPSAVSEAPAEAEMGADTSAAITTETSATEPMEEPKEETEDSATKTRDREPAIERTRSGMSYVVMGIYSSEANARRAVELAAKRYSIPHTDFQLFLYGEKWLVSLGEYAKRAEAQEAAGRYRSEHGAKDVWVYSKQ